LFSRNKEEHFGERIQLKNADGEQNFSDKGVSTLREFYKIFKLSFFNKNFQVQREGLKKLVDEGRFEILTGGWVMTDEANVHLFAMVDQLIEGCFRWMSYSLLVENCYLTTANQNLFQIFHFHSF